MPDTPAKLSASAEKKVSDLEVKKMALQQKIIAMKAAVLDLDNQLLKAGADSFRVSLTMRW